MIRNVLFCIPFATLLLATSASAGDLQIDLQGIRAHTGTVHLALVDSAAGWDGKAAPVQGQSLVPDADAAHVAFRNLPAGDYAVQVTHDENDNGTLDTNLVGIPVEGYGFSNNPRVQRKPTFDEARVHVPADGAAITIVLR